MERRDFVRLAGATALTPGAPRAIDWERLAFAHHTRAWPGYSDALVVDALAGPIQFNIPQRSLPLGDFVFDQIRRSGITAVNLTVDARG